MSVVEQALSDTDFSRISGFVREKTGIALTDLKRTMLQARIQKRMHRLGLSSFAEYTRYLFSPEAQQVELDEFINVVTTNTTEFFRESHHFQFLRASALPALAGSVEVRRNGVRIWSAACSSGEEPYTLAMVLSEHAEQHQDFHWSITATDISTKVIARARQGIYSEEAAGSIPLALRKKYLLRSKDPGRQLVKVAPPLRQSITWGRLNLMDREYGFSDPFHVIFCRNVIIYFDRQTRAELLTRLYNLLVPGGYLFLGHSESLHGISLRMQYAAPTVYRKEAA